MTEGESRIQVALSSMKLTSIGRGLEGRSRGGGEQQVSLLWPMAAIFSFACKLASRAQFRIQEVTPGRGQWLD